MPTKRTRIQPKVKPPVVEKANKMLEELANRTRKQASEANLSAMLGPKDSTAALVQERKSVHGDWMEQATLAQDLKVQVRAAVEEHHDYHTTFRLPPHQREAIEMILVKISRICAGDPSHADHWIDIEGYARLGRLGHEADA